MMRAGRSICSILALALAAALALARPAAAQACGAYPANNATDPAVVGAVESGIELKARARPSAASA
jgi:hypothetical protein